MVIRSSATFSPFWVPPPRFEKVPRPSSALRALKAPPSRGITSATAWGSRTTVYIPGSIACGLRDRTAFFAAARPSDAASMRPQSRAPADAHPDPVASGVRTVVERLASVER
jgi:hypothetical protein